LDQNLLDRPSRSDIDAPVTGLPPIVERLSIRREAKPEEREPFLRGGYEQKSFKPAAVVIRRLGVLAFLFPELSYGT